MENIFLLPQFLNNRSEGEWTGASIALHGPGLIRAGLSPGKVILADLFTTTPFENKLVSLELPGFAIREALEFAVSKPILHVVQVSGVKVVYDLKQKPFNRIVDLKVLCQKCDIPRYEAINDEKYYRVILSDYLADGGDSFSMFPKYERSRFEGPLDIDALAEYVKKRSPINTPSLLRRIQFIETTKNDVRSL